MFKKICGRLMSVCVAVLMAWPVALSAQQYDLDPLPVEAVSTDSLMKHIVELSSEPYAGRLAGTVGHERAMRYVEQNFRRYGLSQINVQQFPIECNEIENAKFNTYLPGSKEKRVFTLGNEFCCAGMTGRGYVDAQMVFVGYGISESAYDDYKGVDVQGKVAVVLTGLPDWMPASVGEHYNSLRDKARTAERHGAIGLLAINTSRGVMPTNPKPASIVASCPTWALSPC